MTPEEIVRDFKTRYQNTFVFAKSPDKDKEILCRVDGIASHRDRQAVIQLSSNEYGKLMINLASNYELKFRFPNVGSFQYGRDSFYITRLAPHRQYQRGLCASNHRIGFCADGVNPMGEHPTRFSLDMVEAAFRQEKYRGDEAFHMLMKETHRSVAIANRFSMCQSLNNSKYPVLFLNHTYLGHVDDNLVFVPAKGAEVMAESAQQALLEI